MAKILSGRGAVDVGGLIYAADAEADRCSNGAAGPNIPPHRWLPSGLILSGRPEPMSLLERQSGVRREQVSAAAVVLKAQLPGTGAADNHALIPH